MSDLQTYLTKVEALDSGQGVAVDFPADLYEQMKWEPGDLLAWTPFHDGTGFTVKKVDVKSLLGGEKA